MTNPIIKIVNSETGEEIQRPMNKEELAFWQSQKTEAENEIAQIDEAKAARQSALEKLAALGLTEAEIAALAG